MEKGNEIKYKSEDDNKNNYAYIIINKEKDKQLNLYLSGEYSFANTLEIIETKYSYLQKNIMEIKVYRFKIYSLTNDKPSEIIINIEDEKNYKSKFTIKIKNYNQNYFEFNFKIENLGISPLECAEQFEIYIDILRNKYGKDRNSKENHDLISSTQIIFEKKGFKTNFLFYFLIFLECFNTQYFDKYLFLLNPKNIKEIGKISETKLKQIKTELNILMSDYKKFDFKNKNSKEKTLELFFALVFYFNYNFQKEKIKQMFSDSEIFNYLFNYFTQNKNIFPDLIIEKQYMDKLCEKVKNFDEILNLLYYIGNDCLQFIKYINDNNGFILSNYMKLNTIIDFQIEIDNYVNYRKDDDIKKIYDEIQILVKIIKNTSQNFIKFSPLMFQKYKNYKNDEKTINLMINSIKSIDKNFQLQTINYIYFIESHEKNKNIRIEIKDNLFLLEPVYSFELSKVQKLFDVTIYRIELVKEIIEKQFNDYNDLKISVILIDENQIKFEKIINKIPKNRDIFVIDFIFQSKEEFMKVYFPPDNCYFTHTEQFEIYFTLVKNELKLQKDEEMELTIALIKKADYIMTIFNVYDMSLFVYIFIECFNLKDLLFKHLQLLELKKINKKALKRMMYYKAKDLLNKLMKYPEIIMENLNDIDKDIFLDKICTMTISFYNYYEKEKINELFNNNYNNQIITNIYKILLRDASFFKNIQLSQKHIREMIKISTNFNELINSISYNNDFLETMEIINEYHNSFVEQFDKDNISPIDAEKIIVPKKEDNFNEIIKLILDIILFEKIKKKYFIYFSPSLIEKSFQSLNTINSRNFINLNEIIYLLRETNNDFKIDNNINNMIYKTGLNFIKNQSLKNIELLKFIENNTYYNETIFERSSYRDLSILKSIKVNRIDNEFIKKWNEIPWLTIFKTQEKAFFETVCSIINNLAYYPYLFKLLYNVKEFNNYQYDIITLIQKKFFSTYKSYNFKDLILQIEFVGQLIYYIDQNNINLKKYISELNSGLGKEFLISLYCELINKYPELSPNIIKIITQFFIKNIDKINIFFFIFLLKNNIK